MLFKVIFEKQIHILKSTNIKTLHQLKASVPKVFKAFPSKFYFCYIDEDGDQITLASDTDFNILLSTNVRSIKIIIKEKPEEFYDQTQKIQIQPETQNQIQALIQNDIQLNEASVIHPLSLNDRSLDESIDQRLKSILPQIVSKIKKEITEELLNISKIQQSQTNNSRKQAKQPQKPKAIHKNYICDGCQKHDIEGIRYKCAVCNDFDFCEDCQQKNDHPHPFLKIRQPSKAPLKIFVILRDSEYSSNPNLINHGTNFTQDLFSRNAQGTKFYTKPTISKQQQKPKIKLETKTQTKAYSETENRPHVNVIPKCQKLPQKTSQVKESSISAQKVEKDLKKEKEQKIIENANYLTNILEANFTKCYTFALKNEHLSKQQLLEKYICHRPF